MKALTKTMALITAICISTSTFASWKVGTDNKFPPYVYDDGNGVQGIVYDIVDTVMQKMEAEYTLDSYAWARVVAVTDGEEVDFSYPWAGKPERFEKYIMVGPIHTGRNMFAIPVDSQISYNRFEDLKGLTIGTVRSYSYGKDFDEANFLKKDSQNTDNKALIKKLQAGRVDVIIGDENVLNAERRKLGDDFKFKFLPKAVKEVDRYVAFPKSNPEKAKKFAAALQAIKDDGTYDAILKKYSK